MTKKEGAIIIIGCILAVKTSLNLIRLVGTGQRVKRASDELVQVQKENQKLKDRLAIVQSPEFLEKEARDKLGLGRPGEEVVIMERLSEEVKPQVVADGRPNWKQWWDLYIGI